MIVFPNAKINLGLSVLGKRADGFHDIETILYPVGLMDALEVIISPDKTFSFTTSGLEISGDPAVNLCVKAWNLLSTGYHLLPVRIHLHKVIPMGSGLGGGSSDGAFTLKLLDSLFSLGLSRETMKDHARKLGSDCAFFIDNTPVFATGKGDELTPLAVTFAGFKLMIVIPAIRSDTASAYGNVRLKSPDHPVRDMISLPVHEWKDKLVNDFEPSVSGQYPVINEIKAELYKRGAVYASMSGSGSAVYGIFPDHLTPDPDFKNCFVWMEKSGFS